MAVTILDFLQCVLTILDIGKEVKNILIDDGIVSVRNILNDKDDAYQYLVYK